MKRFLVVFALAAFLFSVTASAQNAAPAPVSAPLPVTAPTPAVPGAIAPITPPTGAAAQDQKPKTYHTDEVLPLEVALLYYKLVKQEPPYDFLIHSNQELLDKTKGFGQNAMLNQQRDMMKDIYEKSGPDHVITARYKIKLANLIPQTQTVVVGLSPDIPLVYKVTDNNSFGIFMHNAKEIQNIATPYEDGGYDMVSSHYTARYRELSALITLKPIAADPNDFMLMTGQYVHVILADVVEVKIFDRTGKYVILDKRFNGWKPEAELKHDSLLSPDLLPKLQDSNQ